MGLLDRIEKGCQRILDIKLTWRRVILRLRWKVTWQPEYGRTLTIMRSLPLEGNFYDEHGKAVKLAIIPDYNRHIGYVDKLDCMTNSYSISRWTWKWTKKPFFHILDLTILNSFIILTSHGSKLSHWQFRLTLVKALVQKAGRVPQPQTTRPKRQALPRSKYKDLTQDTTDTVSCSVREFCAVCVLPKTKKQEQHTSVENATWSCVLPCVSK